MPHDPSITQKADQIAHRFFSKFALIVDNARAPTEPRDSLTAKIDKWFNLETPDSDIYKDHLRAYRSISSLASPPSPFELQVLLAIPELTNNQVLVFHDPPGPRLRVDPTPTHILLESWQLQFTPTQPQRHAATPPGGEVTLATVYKHGMSLFRSLFTLLRVLPTWRLCKRLRRRGTASRNGALGIEVRIGGLDSERDIRVLRFDTPLSPTCPPLRTSTHAFAPIAHPLGAISLTATFLTTPHFQLDTLESLLSSRFLSLDAGPEFTPTLARTRGESSSNSNSNSHSSHNTNFTNFNNNLTNNNFNSGSPGSLPVRMSLPRSPPKVVSVAERFVLPAASGGGSGSGIASGSGSGSGLAIGSGAGGRQAPTHATTLHPFPSTSPRGRNVPLPPLGPGSGGGCGGGSGSNSPRPPSATGHISGSGGSSSRISQESNTGMSALAARMRRDSGGRGGDLPSAPSGPLPLPIRRPSINAVHPFKSSTLSSGSPSFHSPSRYSPLANGPPRPGLTPSPSSGVSGSRNLPQQQQHQQPGQQGQWGQPPSPMGIGGRTLSSPVPPLRPSPPGQFTPSSLGDRRTHMPTPSPHGGGGVGEGGAGSFAPPPGRTKRYSSSFGHRYAASGGAGSEGSTGSGGGGAGEREQRDNERERERERPASASFLSANTDDDDISAFVQDIDARKPLAGGGGLQVAGREGALGLRLVHSPTHPHHSRHQEHHRHHQHPPHPHPHQRAVSEHGPSSHGSQGGAVGHRRKRTASGSRFTESSSHKDHGGPHKDKLGEAQGPCQAMKRETEMGTGMDGERTGEGEIPAMMHMSHGAIDERLRLMNEAFRASLVGMATRNGSRVAGEGSSTRESTRESARERERERTRTGVASMGRAASLSAAESLTMETRPGARARSGIEMARRAATVGGAGAGGGVGSGSAEGSVSGGSAASGFGEVVGVGGGLGRGEGRRLAGYGASRATRSGSATGSNASEEVMGRLEY